jgi:hypothetical protein
MPHVTKKVIVNTTKSIETNIVMIVEMNIEVNIVKSIEKVAKMNTEITTTKNITMSIEAMNMVMNTTISAN